MSDTARKTPSSDSPTVTALRKPASTTARFLSPFSEFDRLFDEFWPSGWLRPSRGDFPSLAALSTLEAKMPRVDVVDKDNEIVVRAELPGVPKENIEVTVGENSVTIKGESKQEEKEEKGDYYRCEITRGSFARTVALPAAVSSEKAKATFNDGVLELALPKIEISKRRTIKVE